MTALSESGAAVLLGLAVGELLEQVFDVEVTFNNDVFFAIILPPIIFYQVGMDDPTNTSWNPILSSYVPMPDIHPLKPFAI